MAVSSPTVSTSSPPSCNLTNPLPVAPHLPVHLGSMSTCIRVQAAIWKDKLAPGDVLVSNHPEFGGTHLPDITVITPAFSGGRIIFYVASRAHHADIGGILPGSMPPHSKELAQEGAAIKSEKLVEKGIFNEQRMTELLLTEPAKYPGCSGTRCLGDNINDLKAQVAANQKGITLISSLIDDYSEPTVQLYMRAIQLNAADAVRALLTRILEKHPNPLEAIDYMDDGSPIKLRVTITPRPTPTAHFDFTGTGPEMYGNLNAPSAITYSAIIYCLRSLLPSAIPLNQGCLTPINVTIPPGTFLAPSSTAAVVGGNVLTSQRITDVILRAFNAAAASQGDCNNLTFGFGGDVDGVHTPGFGYYETIAGGSGAGPSWHGTDGVHVHMTNTRITDAEIFERRYPVLLKRFSIRPNSGGKGKHRGGNGVIREIEFRRPITVSILSERRVYRPYGLEGGGDAECGLNLWLRKDGKEGGFRTVNLGGKNTADMATGERIIVYTPGGGAWGKEGEAEELGVSEDAEAGWKGGSLAARKGVEEGN